MKIPLNMNTLNASSQKQEQILALERDLRAVQKGDWAAKTELIRQYKGLVQSLAEKRSKDPAVIASLLEKGSEAVGKAALKYNLKSGIERFQLFALDFINSAMDRVEHPGFFARLFKKR